MAVDLRAPKDWPIHYNERRCGGERTKLKCIAQMQFVCWVLAVTLSMPVGGSTSLAQDFDPFATEQLPERGATAPALKPKAEPALKPTAEPALKPTAEPELKPTAEPALKPTAAPAPKPVSKPKVKVKKPGSSVPASTKKIEKIAPPPEAPPPETGNFQLSVGLENTMTVSGLKTALDFAKYTENSVLFPFLDINNQLRPTFKLTSGSAFRINARPFLEIRHNQFFLSSGVNKQETKISADAGESTFSVRPSNQVELTVGQESFQWGTGELASPSNWIYRPTQLAESVSRNPQTVVSTRKTSRLNASIGQFFNFVTIAEYESEQRALPAIFSGRRFLLKSEFAWNSGVDYVGLVVGGAEKIGAPFLGQYFSLSVDDSLRIYGESGHYQGSDVLKPVELNLPSAFGNEKTVVFAQPELTSRKFNHEILVGIRYDILDGTELRLEGYSNSAGYSLSEMRLANDVQKQSSPLFPLFYSPNTEIRSQRSILLALRKANFGRKRNITALIRYWKPVFDTSGGAVLYGEYGFNDNLLLFAAAGGYHGPLVSEAGLPNRFVVLMGQKYVW
ncbi:MAG: hypothetical protein RLZZ488_1852 [Pseudomonadota bacterium]